MKLRRLRTRSNWDALVESFDQALHFHTWDWLDFTERVLGVVFDRYVVEHQGRDVGVFPIGRHTPRSLTSPILPFPFLGPLVPPELVGHVPGALRRQQLRSGLVVGRYEVGPLAAPDWREAVGQSGSAVREINTVVVEVGGLSDGEALRATYSRGHRRSLARAEREGCLIRSPRPGEVSVLLPAFLEEAYGSHGNPSPYPSDVGRLVDDWSTSRADVSTLVAEVRGEPAGLLVVLGGGPTALLWVGGCFRRFRDLRATFLLYHEAMVWAIERSHERIDFLAGIGDPGVRQFKLGFGGQQVSGLRVQSSLIPDWSVDSLGRVRRALR